MSDNTRKGEVDVLREQLNNRLEYIAVLETKCRDLNDVNAELTTRCRDLSEELRKSNLAVEHNRHVADEEQLKGQLRYRDGMIAGLKYAIRCNGVSGGEVNQ